MTFTPTDAANYTTATATVTITVSQGDADDHVAGAGGDHLRHGAERDAAERDGPSVPGTFVYTPAAGTVLNAGAADVVGDVHADRHGELHDGDGDRDDHGVEGDAGDHLAGAGAITYGTALSATQLNATASVPGTFVYSRPRARCSTPASGRRCR